MLLDGGRLTIDGLMMQHIRADSISQGNGFIEENVARHVGEVVLVVTHDENGPFCRGRKDSAKTFTAYQIFRDFSRRMVSQIFTHSAGSWSLTHLDAKKSKNRNVACML